MWTASWALVLYRRGPDRRTVVAMPVILVGLGLALDAFGPASGLGAQTQWSAIGVGVGFAVLAGATFGLVMVLTQHEIAAIDGRLRSAVTMAVVGVLALGVALARGGLQMPHSAPGWWGLVLLALLHGTAFTVMFTLLPRLGVVGSSPILNVEPVAAMVMAWALLGQQIAPVQVLGALIVVGTVMMLGLRRSPSLRGSGLVEQGVQVAETGVENLMPFVDLQCQPDRPARQQQRQMVARHLHQRLPGPTQDLAAAAAAHAQIEVAEGMVA
jgi:drug/metabolite transporter (DMT)-like permease